jgi:anti-anti-sigma factor
LKLYGIEVRESGAGILVELRGELDLHSLDELRVALDGVLRLRRPIVVDLSGITFLDLSSARELAVRSWCYAHHLALRYPSWQVLASAEAFGLERWLDFRPADHEKPPALSETS